MSPRCGLSNRGVAVYKDQIHMGTLDSKLVALDTPRCDFGGPSSAGHLWFADPQIARRLRTKGPGVSQSETHRRPTLAGRYRRRESMDCCLCRPRDTGWRRRSYRPHPSRSVYRTSIALTILQPLGARTRFMHLDRLEFGDDRYARNRLLDHIDEYGFDHGGCVAA